MAAFDFAAGRENTRGAATGDSFRPSDSPNRFGQFELARGVLDGKKHQGGVGLCCTGLSQGFL